MEFARLNAQIAALFSALVLAGCATEDQAQIIALNGATAHCASEGKQFVYNKTEKVPGAVPGLVTNVTVSGYCK